MKQETRANLIFLGVFLAISLPGAVILFKKKLDPTARPMYLPNAPSNTLPYMDPRDAPQTKRYIPERTGQWVATEAGARGLREVVMRDALPVISSGRSFQVVGIDPAAGKADLLLWQMAPEAEVMVAEGGQAEVGQIAGRDVVDLPEEVRSELIRAGFSKPPRQVEWMRVTFEEMDGETAEIRVKTPSFSDSVVVAAE